MNTRYSKLLAFLALSVVSMTVYPDGCDLEGDIPDKWILKKNITIESIVKRSNSVCLAIRESFLKQGREEHAKELKCDTEWNDFQLSKIYTPTDQLHWFNNFQYCPNGGERALDGYVLVRDGQQVAFELKAGIHNKALQPTASGGG